MTWCMFAGALWLAQQDAAALHGVMQCHGLEGWLAMQSQQLARRSTALDTLGSEVQGQCWRRV